MILTVTLNPCIDHTIFTEGLRTHDTNNVLRIETDAGGKGINLSRIVAELGGRPVATGFLGSDFGHVVHRAMERVGVASDFVELAGDTRTNISVESGDGPPTMFSSPGIPVSESDWINLTEKVGSLAQETKWVTLGGSMPSGVPADGYATLGRLAKAAGAFWALDADGEAMRRGVAEGPDVVKPNRHEAQRLLGVTITNLGEATDAVKGLRNLLLNNGSSLGIAVISLGDKGAVAASEAGTSFAVPPPIQAKSTIGSGDSFLGAFLLSLVKGQSPSDALRMGTAAGAATALSDGTCIGSASDTLHLAPLVQIIDDVRLAGLLTGERSAWPDLSSLDVS